MRTLFLLLVLVANAAFAQPSVTRGGALKKRAYQTYSALTFYVDPTGSNSNACTASGTSACLTFDGIYAKLPRIIRHNVTVNVAAGNYTFSSKWDSVQWASVDPSGTATTTLEFLGPALTNVTPTTGTATGTTTAISASIPNPLPTITDSSQSWTVNDLRGRFVTMTSGAANGISRVIVANTATVLTTMPWPTVPTAGDTYAIQTPAAIITGEHSLSGHHGSGAVVRFTRLDFVSSSTTANTWTLYNNAANMTPSAPLTRIRKTTGAFAAVGASRSRPFAGASITGNTAAPWYAEQLGTGTTVTVSDPPNGTLNLLGAAYGASTTGSVVSIDGSGGPFYFPWTMLVAETSSATGVPFSVVGASGGGGGFTINTVSVRCPVGSSAIGVRVENSQFILSNIESVNCATGISMGRWTGTGARRTSNLTLTSGGTSPSVRCEGTTTCVSVTGGGVLRNTLTPTFSGVTNEYTVDGTSYTHTFLNSLTPKRVTGNAGSIVELE